MDKNAIKRYAVWARRELISRVSQKALQYGISEKKTPDAAADSVNGKLLSATEKLQRQSLIAQIQEKGFAQVMEEVAYTWFNRFSALRFMEVNGYLPTHVRVFTDEDNNFKPQIITEAIHLEMDGLNLDKVYAYKEANQTEELYKYLLITQCNALNTILPGMFQRIADYTELLFPDNLLREGSVIEQMIALIPQEDWQDAVQIIGWLYQYYNSEPKDQVFANLKKNIKISKENIPAATQLFTPDWIVRYMVENSLGRLWLEGHPNDELKAGWRYYLDEAEQEADVQAELAVTREEYKTIKPEEIRCIDPCMGSGHILVYMFDVLMQIYEAYGYNQREATASIVENNLYGLDIDDRAAQLAYFAVMMKARQYDRRFFNRAVQPHVYAIRESNQLDKACVEYFVNGDAGLKADMQTLMDELNDAKEYGSILNVSQVDFDALYTRFDEIRDDMNIMRESALNELLPFVQVAHAMAQKYDATVTNPPYLAISNADTKISNFVKKNFPDSKSDLYATFIEVCLKYCKKHGKIGLMTSYTWMFLSTFEKTRKIILTNNSLQSLIQPEYHAFFESAYVPICSYIINKNCNNYTGSYIKLNDFYGADIQEEKVLEAINTPDCPYLYYNSAKNLKKIPGSPIAYWVSEKVIEAYENGQLLGTIAFPKTGMTTGDNNRFLRLWPEIDISKSYMQANNAKDAVDSRKKWFPYCKGGGFKRWYGYNEYLVNWEKDGLEIKSNIKDNGLKAASVRSEQMYFRKLITWSAVTSGKFSCRVSERGALFDSGGSSIAVDSNANYLLALLNGVIGQYYLDISNATINYQPGDIASIPIIFADILKIESFVVDCIKHATNDWNSFETSWEFILHPFIGSFSFIADAYSAWEIACNNRFNQLKANEEELNRIFIGIYGLQDELTPEVEDKDVTIHKADLQRDIKSLLSYALGCMFGRYSLYNDSLLYAGGAGGDLGSLVEKIQDSLHAKGLSRFPEKEFYPDADNIIPICDDEYFPDDIVARFVKFIDTVYGSATLEENLKFIADALGGRGNPREVIRNYFLSDFFTDHCRTYQKRPIYWLFDSGKKNGFKALIYLHRYHPDTLARMRTDYVHEQQARYRTAIENLQQRISGAATAERVKLNKQLTKLQDQATELRAYEEKIHHLADQMIRLDLDDGVKHNYEIFKDVLAKIK